MERTTETIRYEQFDLVIIDVPSTPTMTTESWLCDANGVAHPWLGLGPVQILTPDERGESYRYTPEIWEAKRAAREAFAERFVAVGAVYPHGNWAVRAHFPQVHALMAGEAGLAPSDYEVSADGLVWLRTWPRLADAWMPPWTASEEPIDVPADLDLGAADGVLRRAAAGLRSLQERAHLGYTVTPATPWPVVQSEYGESDWTVRVGAGDAMPPLYGAARGRCARLAANMVWHRTGGGRVDWWIDGPATLTVAGTSRDQFELTTFAVPASLARPVVQRVVDLMAYDALAALAAVTDEMNAPNTERAFTCPWCQWSGMIPDDFHPDLCPDCEQDDAAAQVTN